MSNQTAIVRKDIVASLTVREMTLITAIRSKYQNAKLTIVTRDGRIDHVDNIVSHDDLMDIQRQVLDSSGGARATVNGQ